MGSFISISVVNTILVIAIAVTGKSNSCLETDCLNVLSTSYICFYFYKVTHQKSMRIQRKTV